MYSNPYSQTPTIPENNPHSKKYSLRRRYQNPLREQLDRSKYLRRQEGQFLEGGGEWQGQRWMEEGQSFNCMQSAQRILDFNQAASTSFKNHTKTLSTTPSAFDNPYSHPLQTTLSRPLKESLSSSKKELQPSHTKSQKTAVSHKLSHKSSKQTGQRLRTENNSQPLSTVNYGLYDDYSQGDRRGKVSLKNTNKFSSQSKSELLICLKYSDLKHPISTNKPVRHSLGLQQMPNTDNHLGKYLCSTIKSQSGGCNCNPRCIWMDRWLSGIPDTDFSPSADSPPSSSQWEGTLRQIEKDLPRTQPQHPTFQMPQYLNCLREVLVGYARMDSEVGYVQGMNFIAAALVYHARSSEEALKVMERLMRGQGFRKILLKDLANSHLVSRRCVYQLKRLAFDLYAHLVSQDVQVEVFITSWYFSLLGTFVPLPSMHLVIDKFLRSQFTGLNEIILTLLIYLKSTLLGLYDHSLMMAFSGQQIALAAARIDWEELVTRSDHLLLPPLPI